MLDYDRAFYKNVGEVARRSARHIVPVVLSYIKPKSVIDIGCGTGAWLAVFSEHGIHDFLGVDGELVSIENLEIPSERYVSFDLRGAFRTNREFDLVLCLEVAEHLPPDHSTAFIHSLVRLGPAVLFSAAIPGQGGTHHINERWQSYWAKLFAQEGYIPIDCVRWAVWDNRDVAWWYSQNTILYCDRKYALVNSRLVHAIGSPERHPMDIVHPRKFGEAVWRLRLASAREELAKAIPPGGAFLLIDEATAANAFDGCGRAIPFPQQNGCYSGPPADSSAAISHMRPMLPWVRHVVVLEPAFWWLSFYSDWFNFLQANSCLVHETDLMKIFEMRPQIQ